MLKLKREIIIIINKSHGFEEIKMHHLLLKSNIKRNNPLVKTLLKNIHSTKKLKASRAEAERFCDFFRMSNIILNYKFNISEHKSIFLDDFDNYNLTSKQEWDDVDFTPAT